ncbi:MAG: hypothetical protein L0H25_04605 [Micrococcales bacterium]|nr:hypothetical protein [Micrococcales bacterium]
MHRPSTRRHGVLTALLCAVSLAACTGNGGDGSDSAPTPAVAPSVATTTATSVVTEVAQATSDVTKGGAKARAEVYVGPALESANAWAKVAPGHTAKERAAKQLSTEGIEVLAISRGQQWPHQILAKTTLKQSKAAVLVLLVSEQAGEDFKAAAVTPLLPGATIEALAPVDEGSAPLGDGSGLAATPDEVVTAFAGSVKYPDPEPSDLLDPDAWSEQLRKAAKDQAKALGSVAVYTQTHTPGGVLGGFRLGGDKGAVVFANLVRDETIAWRSPTKLKPGKDFTALTGIKSITSEAKLTSNEILAMVIPQTGKAEIVAAADQLVDGSGR